MEMRLPRSIMWRRLCLLVLAALTLFFYNEYIVYYVVLLQCQWPSLNPSKLDYSIPEQHAEPIKVMMLADTHLLGAHEGHWFDKLRREWQMERTFQTCMTVHSPDVVFVLGDALDEGKWSNDQAFRNDVLRFRKMFTTPFKTDTHVIVGNHDIGFHYMIDSHKRSRFSSAFSSPTVRKLVIGGNVFVTLNSMAMEGDGCNMCSSAERKLQDISLSLKCSQNNFEEEACQDQDRFSYTRPILLQHFPMYRESDSKCSGPDEAPPDIKFQHMKPRLDCLSENASNKLLDWLSPRLIVTGHTHFGCERVHRGEIPEYTIPSFNWRNTNQPAFILARISPSNFAVSKCYMPRESTVIYTYICGGIVIAIWFLLPCRSFFTTRSLKTS